MGVNMYYLELIFILVNAFYQQKLMKKDILIETLFLKKKGKKHQKKKLGCKFIRINTSNAKNAYDLDYEVGNVQAFIDDFKNKKTKKNSKTINKRKRNEREIRKQLIKEKTNETEIRKRNVSRKQKVQSRNKRIKRQKLKNQKI